VRLRGRVPGGGEWGRGEGVTKERGAQMGRRGRKGGQQGTSEQRLLHKGRKGEGVYRLGGNGRGSYRKGRKEGGSVTEGRGRRGAGAEGEERGGMYGRGKKGRGVYGRGGEEAREAAGCRVCGVPREGPPSSGAPPAAPRKDASGSAQKEGTVPLRPKNPPQGEGWGSHANAGKPGACPAQSHWGSRRGTTGIRGGSGGSERTLLRFSRRPLLMLLVLFEGLRLSLS